MRLLRWFTKNWANTTEPTHRDLRPLSTARPAEEVEAAVRNVVAALPRWRIESANTGEIRLTRRTRIIGFIDDVVLMFEPAAGGTTIHATSRSRVGIGDLGQNRRNILELFSALRTHL